jgi:ribonuclease Z
MLAPVREIFSMAILIFIDTIYTDALLVYVLVVTFRNIHILINFFSSLLQLQVQRTPSIRPSKVSRIFVSHAHGDHSFGLPGLLCLMGQDRDRENSPPVEIYGPEGLRVWLRVAIRYSVSRIVPNYRVHELKDIPMAPEWELSRKTGRYYYKGLNKQDPRQKQWGFQGLAGEDSQSWISRASMMSLEPSHLYGEVDGGQDIYPIYDHPKSSDGAPVWEVSNEEDVQVFAAPMSHGIPCVGYVVEEKSRPGRLRDDVIKPIVQRNLGALKKAGFSIPMKAMAVIKNLPVGSAFTFPDGTVVTQQEAVEPPRKGRKVVICGDTASARAIEGMCKPGIECFFCLFPLSTCFCFQDSPWTRI